MVTLEDPLICGDRKLGTGISRRISTALAAVFLLLGFQPSLYQVHAQEPGLVVATIPQIDYLEKPILPLTQITPSPVVVKKVSTKKGIIHAAGYSAGYCTAFAASMRTDLPTNLGDARFWITRARDQGFATGTVAAPGAIVETRESRYGHVAYVTGVSASAISVREANVEGWNKVSTREIPIDSNLIVGYIY